MLLKSNCTFLGHNFGSARNVWPAAALERNRPDGEREKTHHHVVGDVDVRLGRDVAVDEDEGDVVVVVGLLSGRERVAVGVVAAHLDLALAAAAAAVRRGPRGAVGRPQWTHLRHFFTTRAAKTKVRAAFLPLGVSLKEAARGLARSEMRRGGEVETGRWVVGEAGSAARRSKGR